MGAVPLAEVTSFFQSDGVVQVEQDNLTVVEDLLVQQYLPLHPRLSAQTIESCERNWHARERFIDAFRGKHYLGNVEEVEFELMTADDLLAIPNLNSVVRRALETDASNVLGIYATANIQSSSITGSIERAIGYMRLPRGSSQISATGTLWKRYVNADTGDNTIEEVFRDLKGRQAGSFKSGGGTKSKKVGIAISRHK